MWGFAHQWLGGFLGLRRIWTNSYDHLDHPSHRLRRRYHMARRVGTTSVASLDSLSVHGLCSG
jgi:hypothetical protein